MIISSLTLYRGPTPPETQPPGHTLTFLIESHSQIKWRITRVILGQDRGIMLQQLHQCEGLSLGTVLAGKMQWSVPFIIGQIYLKEKS